MNALKTAFALVAAALLGLLAMVSAFVRKTAGKEAADKLDKLAEQAKAAAELRAKVADAKAARALAMAEQEKARDTVDVANDLILGVAAADDDYGNGER